MGKSIMCTINCKHRIAATLYTLETWLQVFGNALHKGVDYDD
jgi:hypothetical protein